MVKHDTVAHVSSISTLQSSHASAQQLALHELHTHLPSHDEHHPPVAEFHPLNPAASGSRGAELVDAEGGRTEATKRIQKHRRRWDIVIR